MATGLHAAALPLNHWPRGLSCKSDGPVASLLLLLLLLSGRMLGGWTLKDQLDGLWPTVSSLSQGTSLPLRLNLV